MAESEWFVRYIHDSGDDYIETEEDDANTFGLYYFNAEWAPALAITGDGGPTMWHADFSSVELAQKVADYFNEQNVKP